MKEYIGISFKVKNKYRIIQFFNDLFDNLVNSYFITDYYALWNYWTTP